MQNRMTSNPNFKINQNNNDNKVYKEQSHSLSRDSSRASTREDKFVKGLKRLKLSSILRVWSTTITYDQTIEYDQIVSLINSIVNFILYKLKYYKSSYNSLLN